MHARHVPRGRQGLALVTAVRGVGLGRFPAELLEPGFVGLFAGGGRAENGAVRGEWGEQGVPGVDAVGDSHLRGRTTLAVWLIESKHDLGWGLRRSVVEGGEAALADGATGTGIAPELGVC